MKVVINGKLTDTDCTHLLQLYGRWSDGSKQAQEDVIILNGYNMNEDSVINENDSISFITKGSIPGKNELEAMMASRHSPMVHKKVKEAKVAVAGLGGLGSHVAVMLARTGVGELLLVDFDVVEPSNLNRQHYRISHLGMKKTEAMKQQLKEINPYIVVNSKTIRVTEENAAEIFLGYPIICEAFDRAEAKAMLVETVLSQLKSTYLVGGSGMAGYASSNLIKTKRQMKRLYVCGDFENEAAIGNGLMAPRVEVCAGHQANMILRLLLGIEEE